MESRQASRLQAPARRCMLATAGGALLVGTILAGCSPPRPPEEPAPSGTSTVAAPTATLSSPRGSSSIDWGPLAVIPPQAGMDLARTEGTLRITNECVFLDARGGPVLLMWPADRVRWDPLTGAIVFLNVDGATVSVGDGSAVALGGGGDSNEESGTTTAEWLAKTLWVARPAATCPLEVRWSVGSLSG